jgi:hypothetical protein
VVPLAVLGANNSPQVQWETNPSVWLEDYRLVCHAGGRGMISSSLRTYHSTSPTLRTRLEHLPRGRINNWAELRRAFIGNFQGTHAHPSKQWELRNCK